LSNALLALAVAAGRQDEARPSLVLRASHAWDGTPIAGAVISRVEARTEEELRSLLEQRFLAAGIADQVERWTRFAGETRLPPDPETGGVPFVPGAASELGRTDASGAIELHGLSTGSKLLVSADGCVSTLVELDPTDAARVEVACPLSRA